MGGRRYSRASDDPEKTNTTYAEDSQPTQDITIRLDESDALSASSCHEGEPERFVSTGSTGRRVSFNESTLYEQEKTAQDKGRRYTLTEGDFHHLKKARLTHLHLPPAPCDLKILTIMECDSADSSTVNISEAAAPKLPLAIYQPAERRVPEWLGQGLSGGLPGDPHHSIILDQGLHQTLSTMKAQHIRSQTMEAIGDRGEAENGRTVKVDLSQAASQTSVLHFFSKLRRHASLEGAGPYFKRWKFDSSHRAASLDAKGSPKRRPFQRQRAASETTDHTEDEALSLQDEVIESLPDTPIQSSGLQSLSAESLSQHTSATTSSVFLSRPNLESMVEVREGSGTKRKELCPAQRGEKATTNGLGLENKTEPGLFVKLGKAGATEDDLFGEQREVQSQFGDKLIKSKDTKREETTGEERKKNDVDMDDGEEAALGAGARRRADSGSSFSFVTRQESLEAPPSLYRDIWSLRASLEQYASSDQSSTDRESIRSDADSVSSYGCAGARPGLDSCLSQDLDDYPEGDGDGEMLDGGIRGASGGDIDLGSGAGGENESGNRKLLQMDSGYASIEAPTRAPEEMRLFGTPGAPRGKTASERRLFFTSSGRKGSVCESTEAKLFQEELEDEMGDSTGTEEEVKNRSHNGSQSHVLKEPHHPLKSYHHHKPPDSQSQLVTPLMKSISQPSSPHRPRLRRRDYSIDEKTDALFNEFLRHDPRFDQQDSPMRSRHRSRVHLRKQWQRQKQYSDPGSSTGGRYSPSLERQRFTPLRRGDSAGYPLDTRYHSTLSRIASAADEEASEVADGEESANGSTEVKDQTNEVAAEDNEDAAEETSEDTDGGMSSTNHGASCGEGNCCQVSTNKDVQSTTSQTLTEQTCGVDPRGDNRNNNSSQVILSEAYAALSDKLVQSVEERLYGGLRSAEKLSQRGSEQVLTVSHTASPGFSPT
ncbi:uncharacterized protein cbarpa isoform X2 [Cynoglossus semilaevis]|nr:uncharacterized protein LOC103395953 isoform X2 [Cynoglossus semilaevis]